MRFLIDMGNNLQVYFAGYHHGVYIFDLHITPKKFVAKLKEKFLCMYVPGNIIEPGLLPSFV